MNRNIVQDNQKDINQEETSKLKNINRNIIKIIII